MPFRTWIFDKGTISNEVRDPSRKRLLANRLKWLPALLLLVPALAWAHEAYVLSPSQLQTGLLSKGFNPFVILKDPGSLRLFLLISIAVVIVLVITYRLSRSKIAARIAWHLEKFQSFGPWLVRIAIAASFFFSALNNSFLGPEIPLSTLPHGEIIRWFLFALSILILTGLMSEVTAILSLILFGMAAMVHHWYMATYANYLGEFFVMVFLGSYLISPKLKRYEHDIVRIFYGLALIYTDITVKFLHPQLTLAVVKRYHLTQFHWLFPSNPMLLVLGAALAELIIGLFILLGFQLRLTVLISLFYITLSLLFFRELVWPHFLLYGISLNLLITPQKLALDSWLAWRL